MNDPSAISVFKWISIRIGCHEAALKLLFSLLLGQYRTYSRTCSGTVSISICGIFETKTRTFDSRIPQREVLESKVLESEVLVFYLMRTSTHLFSSTFNFKTTGYPLCILYNLFLVKKSPQVKHVFFLSCGFLIGMFNYGKEVHPSLSLFLFPPLSLFQHSRLWKNVSEEKTHENVVSGVNILHTLVTISIVSLLLNTLNGSRKAVAVIFIFCTVSVQILLVSKMINSTNTDTSTIDTSITDTSITDTSTIKTSTIIKTVFQHFALVFFLDSIFLWRFSNWNIFLFFPLFSLQSYLLWGYYKTQSDEYAFEWTIPQCVLTLRLISTAFDVYDGARKKESDLKKKESDSKKQDQRSVTGGQEISCSLSNQESLDSVPSFLQLLGHCYFPAAFLVGPQFGLHRYLQFVSMNQSFLSIR